MVEKGFQIVTKTSVNFSLNQNLNMSKTNKKREKNLKAKSRKYQNLKTKS